MFLLKRWALTDAFFLIGTAGNQYAIDNPKGVQVRMVLTCILLLSQEGFESFDHILEQFAGAGSHVFRTTCSCQENPSQCVLAVVQGFPGRAPLLVQKKQNSPMEPRVAQKLFDTLPDDGPTESEIIDFVRNRTVKQANKQTSAWPPAGACPQCPYACALARPK